MTTLSIICSSPATSSPTLLLAITAIGTPLVALAAVVWSNINTGRQLKLTRNTVTEQLTQAAETSAAQIEASRIALDRQIKANIISTNRQRWIDLLRDDVAEFLERHVAYRDFVEGTALSAEEKKAAREAKERRALLYQRIRLRLNPGETEHNELVTDLGVLMTSTSAVASDPAFERVVAHVQPILKAEWERVKNLEQTGQDGAIALGAAS